MHTHADKTPENKSQSVANAVSQKQSGGESAFQIVDNRPEAIAQRQLQEMADNSPQAKRAAQLQAMADDYSARQQPFIQKKENKTGLPDNLKTGIENLSGYSMDDVKVYHNLDKPAQLQAHAYAEGMDIHLGTGQEKHLPHEAWHVVQQKQGRVKPTMQMKGKVNINDDVRLEKEADVMGKSALQINSALFLQNTKAKEKTSNITGSFKPVQPKWVASKEGILKWDILIAGVRWYFRQSDGTMYYLIENEEDRYQKHSGIENARSHAEWVKLHGADPLKYLDASIVSEGEDKSKTHSDSAQALEKDEEKLKAAIKLKIEELEKIINEVRTMGGYGPIDDKLLIEKKYYILKWLLDVLEDAGWTKEDTMKVHEFAPGFLTKELDLFMQKIKSYYNKGNKEDSASADDYDKEDLASADDYDKEDSASADEDDKEGLDAAIKEEVLEFEEAAQIVLEKAPSFRRAKLEIAKFEAGLKREAGIYLASETTTEAMERSIEYLNKLMAMRSKLEELKSFDFDSMLKKTPEKILEKYRLTAAFDNNITPDLAAGIVGKIKDHFNTTEKISGQLKSNIEEANMAVVKVIEKLLDTNRSFPIGITGGKKGDTDSGVTKRDSKNDSIVTMILIHVGDVMEKLNKNAQALDMAVPALAEYGTLFHELSHSINHDNKRIDGIGPLAGGHAKPDKVYDMEDTKGWFYDPDFIAALILAGLDESMVREESSGDSLITC